MVRYSNLREKLNIEINKNDNDALAYFTHYLQNNKNGCKSYFEEPAIEYLKRTKNNSVIEFQKILPLEFDIPFPPTKNPKFTFIDLFAGIGGIRLAYQNIGGKCVFSSEWNHFAKRTYEANFGEVPFGDITKIHEKNIPDHDILTGGFPCQPFSIAGVSKKKSLGRDHGFLDKTQGTLFFDIARIIKEKRPKAFMLENVKNLRSHDKGRTFQIIRQTLEDLNYHVFDEVLDGQHYVPQHRERIIIVGFDKERYSEINFEYPEPPSQKQKIKDILEKDVNQKYTLSDKLWNYLHEYSIKQKAKGNGFGYGMVDLNSISRTMSARYYKDGAEILIPQNGNNPRRLTPNECKLLQGFPNEFTIPVSDNQAYRQFGNSVVVPLIQDVAKKILKALKY
jgi:DNA (cytosine-5)-methyltransferase 1